MKKFRLLVLKIIAKYFYFLKEWEIQIKKMKSDWKSTFEEKMDKIMDN